MADSPFLAKPFEGRTAVVTGGSRGIGRACAEMLAAGGAKVGVVYAGNTAAADETVAAIQAAGGEAEAMQCDVTDNAAAAALIAKVVEDWGKLDILVNNAGIIRDGLFATMSPENWGAVIETNLTGVYNFCHAATMPMMRARYGRIVNMSSVAAHYSNPGQANYAASKGGIEGLTRCLATEIAKRGVTVNAVAPGLRADGYDRGRPQRRRRRDQEGDPPEAARHAGGHRPGGLLPGGRTQRLRDRPDDHRRRRADAGRHVADAGRDVIAARSVRGMSGNPGRGRTFPSRPLR